MLSGAIHFTGRRAWKSRESCSLGQAGSLPYPTSFMLQLHPSLVPSLVPISITYIAFYNIIRVIHDIAGQAKVTDLGYPSI